MTSDLDRVRGIKKKKHIMLPCTVLELISPVRGEQLGAI